MLVAEGSVVNHSNLVPATWLAGKSCSRHFEYQLLYSVVMPQGLMNFFKPSDFKSLSCMFYGNSLLSILKYNYWPTWNVQSNSLPISVKNFLLFVVQILKYIYHSAIQFSFPGKGARII